MGTHPLPQGKTPGLYTGPQSRQTRQYPDEGKIQSAWGLWEERTVLSSPCAIWLFPENRNTRDLEGIMGGFSYGFPS